MNLYVICSQSGCSQSWYKFKVSELDNLEGCRKGECEYTSSSPEKVD